MCSHLIEHVRRINVLGQGGGCGENIGVCLYSSYVWCVRLLYLCCDYLVLISIILNVH